MWLKPRGFISDLNPDLKVGAINIKISIATAIRIGAILY